jgi:membrane-associated phospholipid phosphatase
MSTTSTNSTNRVGVRRRLPGGRRLSDGHYLYWWVELLAILIFYAVYSAVRNSVSADPTPALHHARNLIHWEHLLGIYHEETLQRWALHFEPLIVSMNYVYGSLHFVVTAGVGIYLFRQWSDDYPKWRNTLAITTGLALIGFYTWPLMPPRLLDANGFHTGFVDTLAKYPTIWSFNSGEMSKLSNQFAAMPSVHCAWALFCACALVPRLKQRWAKILAACYPALTVTAIVLTGNHYFLDAVGGFVTLGIGYAVASKITRAGRGARVVDVSAAEAAEVDDSAERARRTGTG